MEYKSTNGRTYTVVMAVAHLKDGKTTNVYFMLPSERKDQIRKYKVVDKLPDHYIIREVSRNGFPLISRKPRAK